MDLGHIDRQTGRTESMRLVLARTIDSSKALARDLPPLTRRVVEVSRNVESLQAVLEEEKRDKAALRLVDSAWAENPI